GGGLGGADLSERPADFLECGFATFGGGIEVRVPEVLRQDGYRDVPAVAGAVASVPSFVPVVGSARAGRWRTGCGGGDGGEALHASLDTHGGVLPLCRGLLCPAAGEFGCTGFHPCGDTC